MKLSDWLEKNNVNKSHFAERIGISRTHLYEIMNNTAGISKKLAQRIEEETNREVTIMELMFPDKYK